LLNIASICDIKIYRVGGKSLTFSLQKIAIPYATSMQTVLKGADFEEIELKTI